MTMRRRRALLALVGGIAAVVSPAVTPWPAQAQGMAPTIDAPAAKGLVEAGGLLVDVRTPRELRENGRPAGSVHVPLQGDDLTFNPDFVKQLLEAAGGDRSRPVALICSGNRRSAHAARVLAGQGFIQVFSVGEGIFGSNLGPGWAARGLPMEACPAC